MVMVMVKIMKNNGNSRSPVDKSTDADIMYDVW